MGPLCVCRDIKHLGSLESSQGARVALGWASCNSYACLFRALQTSRVLNIAIRTRTHKLIVNLKWTKNWDLSKLIDYFSGTQTWRVCVNWFTSADMERSPNSAPPYLTTPSLRKSWASLASSAWRILCMKSTLLGIISKKQATFFGHSSWTHQRVVTARSPHTSWKAVIMETARSRSTGLSAKWIKVVYSKTIK